MIDRDAQEIERLREENKQLRAALYPFAKTLLPYRRFSEHQLILLSEDNPKGRRLNILLPNNFRVAEAMFETEQEPEHFWTKDGGWRDLGLDASRVYTWPLEDGFSHPRSLTKREDGQ